MIDPRKFSKPNFHPTATKFFRFGLNDKDEIAKELRRFADAVESGEYLLQHVQTGSLSDLSDYQMHAVMFEYAAKELVVKESDKGPTKVETLYSGDNQFPIDIAKKG